jgi:diguanylate cyclase (GGDEF)-like protein
MISLKKYLEMEAGAPNGHSRGDAKTLLPVLLAAYRSALMEMGSCSLAACPALGDALQRGLDHLAEGLDEDAGNDAIVRTESRAGEQLQDWGRRTARHYRQKTSEVKEILIVLARTAESVGERDHRCADQIASVTARLRKIANLEDLTEIRASIEASAAELKSSIDKMAAEGKAAAETLRAQVTNYQARLEEAEHIASIDSLTRLRNRLWIEGHIDRRIEADALFCIAIIDLNGFKQVNDQHGHMVGDELLKQFAAELRSACRSTDVLGRWGGDEFIVLLECGLEEANTQTDRLMKWVCGNYVVQGSSGPKQLRVDAALGLAERKPKESIKQLLARADARMYEHKATTGLSGIGSRR